MQKGNYHKSEVQHSLVNKSKLPVKLKALSAYWETL